MVTTKGSPAIGSFYERVFDLSELMPESFAKLKTQGNLILLQRDNHIMVGMLALPKMKLNIISII